MARLPLRSVICPVSRTVTICCPHWTPRLPVSQVRWHMMRTGAGKTTTLGIWSIDLDGRRRSPYALTWADGLDSHPKQTSVMSPVGDDLMYLLRDSGRPDRCPARSRVARPFLDWAHTA